MRDSATIMATLMAFAALLSAAENASHSAQQKTSGTAAHSQSSQAQHELWRNSVAPPADEAPGASLRKAIRDVLATEVNPQPERTDAVAQEPQAGAETPERPTTQPATTATTQPATRTVPQPKDKHSGLSPATLTTLRSAAAKGISKPIMLADSLYRGGYLPEAAEVYELAEKAAGTEADRAWAIYQMANCKRNSEPDVALGLYRRLVSEYPDCCWSLSAQMKGEIISWEQVNTPEKVLEEISDFVPSRAARAVHGQPEGTTAATADDIKKDSVAG